MRELKALTVLRIFKEVCHMDKEVVADIDEALAELKAPKSCFECEYRSVFDPYCNHPSVLSKYVPEYINNVGCNYYEPKDNS